MGTISYMLLVFAFVLFTVATIVAPLQAAPPGAFWPYWPGRLVAAGLACWVAASLFR